MLIIIMAVAVLIVCILTAVLLSFKLPKRTNEQLEVLLLNNSDCSLEKVIINLQFANKIGDIEDAVQKGIE